jgi:hypothetical protein
MGIRILVGTKIRIFLIPSSPERRFEDVRAKNKSPSSKQAVFEDGLLFSIEVFD